MSNKNRNKGGANRQQPQAKAKAPVKELAEIEVCYWTNPRHSVKFGLMTGLVTKEQAAWYDSVTPEGTTYKNATSSYDPIEKRHKDARKRLKNKDN